MFFIFRNDFIPPTNENFWEDSILSDDNNFTVLQNCLISRISFSFRSKKKKNPLRFLQNRHNNLAVIIDNGIALDLFLEIGFANDFCSYELS